MENKTVNDNNIILLTDSYKVSHHKQYPPEIQKVYSYLESRGGKFDATVFFGLQIFLKKYLEGQVVTKEKIDEAEALFKQHFGSDKLFNRIGWEYILKKYDGRLPVIIKAVPEGTLVPTHNVLMTVENSDIEVPWLTNYLETLLVQVWYPTTVATLSYNMHKLISEYLEATGDPSLVNFKLHDFGFRGVSSVESAGMGGAAHLVNFMGTDTLAAITTAQKYYKAGMPGFSIPAAEHSTICSWGKAKEVDAFRNMLQQYPSGLVAVVSDSYDIFNACKNLWGKELKKLVLKRNGTLVIRPDSGDPQTVVVEVLNILKEAFGGEVNSKGYFVLDSHVRVIQGDGINFESTREILEAMKQAGFSSDNIAFGMGGKLLQGVDRDTQKFAFKCSQVVVDSIPKDVFKSPITDPGKNSKKGVLKLIQRNGEFATVPDTAVSPESNLLAEVFWNGQLQRELTFDEVKANLLNSSKVAVRI